MEKYPTKQDKLRASLRLSLEMFDIKDIAEQLDYSRTAISDALNGKRMSPTMEKAIDAFVRKHGYWIWDSIAAQKDVVPWDDTANELESLAASLRSGIALSSKKRRFESFIKDAMDMIVAAKDQGKKQ